MHRRNFVFLSARGGRTALLAAIVLAASCAKSAIAAEGVDRAEELREAWIAHRLERNHEQAQRLYEEVFGAKESSADQRARSAIGLAIFFRDSDDMAQAQVWLSRAMNVNGASPRWVRTAVTLAARIDEARKAPELERIETLKVKVERLATDHEQLVAEVAARDKELGRLRELVSRFEEGARLEAKSGFDRLPLIETSEAARLLDQIKEGEREEARARHHFVQLYLERGLEHFQAGRFLLALNEAKKVLDIDPLHRVAQDLIADCRSIIAAAAGARALDGSAADGPADKHARVLLLEGMRANLQEGRRLYQQGRVPLAHQKLQLVLSDYAWSPIRLSNDEISTIVEPAEHLLRKILAERGDTEEAEQLRGRETALLVRLQEAFQQRAKQEVAFEKLDALIEAMKSTRPDEAEAIARRELERSYQNARDAAARGVSKEAEAALRDMLILLDFFPGLDPSGVLRDDAVKRLRAVAPLEAGD